MAGMTHGARTDPREHIVLAVILIIVGVGALTANAVPDLGGWVVLLIGVGLFALFAFSRAYGALVPGGIMTGLGAGILVSEATTWTDEAMGGVIVLGLGLGFASIWVLGALTHVKEHHVWPLIPGGILTVIGIALMVGGQAIELMEYWPVILIAIGVVVLGRGWMELRQR